MGHYLSEMMCDTCKRARCICPPKPDTSLEKWIVDTDFTVIQVKDFDNKTPNGMGLLARYRKEHFDKKEDAEAHAIELKRKLVKYLEVEIKLAKIQIRRLKKELDGK